MVCYPVIGGSGVVATELGVYLAQRGHQVHFFSYALPFRLDPELENLYYHQVETSNYPLFKYPPYTLTLSAKIAEGGDTGESGCDPCALCHTACYLRLFSQADGDQ